MDYGLIVDVETTGLDCTKDTIIELGLVEFAVEGADEPMITSMYGGVEDPGVALSPEIAKLTGLESRFITGRRIDWALVRTHFARAGLVIAHNAPFDRSFLERRAELQALTPHWACSMRHVNWAKKGFKSTALNYLAADHGFVNPFAHRALFDCATTFRLVKPHLRELIDRSYEKDMVISATEAPFEAKDKLKARGYRWESERRVWSKIVGQSELEDERVFLASEVYRGAPRHQETELAPNWLGVIG